LSNPANEAAAIQRRAETAPVTVDSLSDDLRALGLQAGMLVLVHSSLSALGWVCGGPVAVIEALENVLGPDGTLVMPTHSGDLSEPSYWENPPVPESWWPVIRATMPAFQPDLTPTRGMGAIAECFRKQAGVQRSAHPAVSFAARGPLAEVITAGHTLAASLGAGSPLDHLYAQDGWVLLLGVGHGNNTSLHLAEYRADFPGKRIVQQGAPVLVDSVRQWVTYDDLDFDDEDFPQIGAVFEAAGGGQRGPVGSGETRLMRQRQLVDFAVTWIAANRQTADGS
jgi:aminoglycoside 3-N-acetyltransferase